MRRTLVNMAMASMLLMMPGDVLAQQAPAPSKFKMASVYYDEDWIPVQFTCGVADPSSPEVKWMDAPAGTTSFGLIFHDIDAAPGKSVMDVTHWLVWNIPASATQLAESVQPNTSPDGIQQGKNVRGVNGYQPPCPPVGVRPHHYVFELYALDTKLDLATGAGRAELLKAMDGHVIGKASLVGIFGQGIDEKTWETAKPPEQ